MTKNRTCLIILDGWGLGKPDSGNAVFMAETPCMDSLWQSSPHAQLRTDGENVGLPAGQMGNSEVGHMNIGAGRIVYQELARINHSIASGELQNNAVLKEAMATARRTGKKLHLIGLVSDGGVHAHIDHAIALCEMAAAEHVSSVFIHAITDGRDTDPHSGKQFLEDLESRTRSTGALVASVVGRYFAMDRDKRWERVSKAFALFTSGKGRAFSNAGDAVDFAYNHGTTDEFIEPSVICDSQGKPLALIENGDVVICFNFRTDRCREITQVLTQEALHEYNMFPLPLHFVTFTRYDESFRGIHVVFEKDNLENTLGEVISAAGLSQVRIAETEKYPHVTFFFNGGREKEFPAEKRILVHSPKVATYDQQPEMSAEKVTQRLVDELKHHSPDFVCLNFANPDMVGHTGVFPAIVKAVETADRCLKIVVETGQALGYSFIILADHGNAEYAVNEDGTPNTAHTTNPVPVIILDDRVVAVSDGILADVAPTILQLLGISKPPVMTGKSLVTLK